MIRRVVIALVTFGMLTGVGTAHAAPFKTWKSNYIASHDIHMPIVGENVSVHTTHALLELKGRNHTLWLRYRAAEKAWKLAHLPVSLPSPKADSGGSVGYGGHSGAVPDLIRQFFAGGDVARALCTANRESRFNPNAYNPSSGASGVFQFVPKVWPDLSSAAGYGGSSPFSAVANIGTAAWVVRNYGWWPWNGGCL